MADEILPAAAAAPAAPAAPTAAPAAATPPALPAASSALPGDSAGGGEQQRDPEAESKARSADWETAFGAGTPTPKVDPPAGVVPEIPTVPAEKEKPAAGESAKPKDEQPPVVPPKLPEAAAAAKPPGSAESEELPENLMEGIGEENPTNHRDALKRTDKMAKRMRLAGEKIKALKAQLAAAPGKPADAGATPGPELLQVQQAVKKVEGERDDLAKQLSETRDRLYAQELTARPEYQDHVIKPWNDVKKTINTICAKYHQDPKDVWDAYRMEKPEERDAAFSEMLTVMNPQDQYRFNQAIERVPQITEAQKMLEAHSKEKVEQYRQADQAKAERGRSATISQATAAAKAHYDERRAAVPFLYHVDGDAPEIQQYNQGMKEALELADKLTREGVDRLSPEVQGKMVHDAVTADFIVRNVAGALRVKDQKNAELAAKVKELETLTATLQSEVDGYRGATPSDGGLPGAAGANGSATATLTLQENTARHAAGLGWT